MTVVSAAVLLFLVMDPLGNILFFLSALRHVPPERQPRIVLRELCIALAALLLFLFAGGHLLRLLGLSEPALGVAGGVILMLIALRMVFPSPESPLEEEVKEEPFIVPLAIPYVAGPSSLATVLLLMSREPDRWMDWVGAILLAWAACVPIMLACGPLRNLLGKRGLTAVERLMGLVLVTIAVQMLMTGVADFLAQHRA
ncbi:MAG: MarC family protein [Gammaproteobacteria bacterium]|nr:MarC family protein [Gammaproteobacteria bacterium]